MDNDLGCNVSARENSKEESTEEPIRQRKKAPKSDKPNKRSARKSKLYQCDNLLIQRAAIRLSHDLDSKLNSRISVALLRSLITTRPQAVLSLRKI
jgi:hypothetical protein